MDARKFSLKSHKRGGEYRIERKKMLNEFTQKKGKIKSRKTIMEQRVQKWSFLDTKVLRWQNSYYRPNVWVCSILDRNRNTLLFPLNGN